MGDAGRLRPHRSSCDEEAQLTPHGKRASWSGNQLTHSKIATIFTKNSLLLKILLKKVNNLLIMIIITVIIENSYH